MKRIITVELLENHANANLYTVKFDGEGASEFDDFLNKFDDKEEFNTDVDNIAYWAGKIGEVGALERFFRPERGKMKALPIDTSKLRLYCYKIDEGIVLIGNGGIKKTKTFNEDPKLDLYAGVIEQVGIHLSSRLKSGQVTKHNNILYGNLTFTIELPDAKE